MGLKVNVTPQRLSGAFVINLGYAKEGENDVVNK